MSENKLGILTREHYGAAALHTRFLKAIAMADKRIPHFHNEAGVPTIQVGAKEFMCIGAKPPFDHPHIFLDMGGDEEIVCPYCSTLFKRDSTLSASEARPAASLWVEGEVSEKPALASSRL